VLQGLGDGQLCEPLTTEGSDHIGDLKKEKEEKRLKTIHIDNNEIEHELTQLLTTTARYPLTTID
jgi:hypothetical protein